MTIFSKIIAGEIPCFKIAENEKFFALLDIFPAVIGHTLVVPKMPIDQLFELPDDYLDGYLSFCKPIAHAIQSFTGCKRVNIITIGFEVPHAHIHLIPMNRVSDMNFAMPKLSFSKEEMEATAEAIRKNIIF